MTDESKVMLMIGDEIGRGTKWRVFIRTAIAKETCQVTGRDAPNGPGSGWLSRASKCQESPRRTDQDAAIRLQVQLIDILSDSMLRAVD